MLNHMSPKDWKGLNDDEVIASRAKHGDNQTKLKTRNIFIEGLIDIFKEPMVLLLLVASVIYFSMGAYDDGIFLSAAILLVASISLFQENRSKRALKSLQEITQPKCKVIRNGQLKEIDTQDVVIKDLIQVEEGTIIPADAVIVQSNDFSINESILTGESYAVYKNKTSDNPYIYQGTIVASGLAIAQVTAIANQTKLGSISEKLSSILREKTPLEQQIQSFVKKMVVAGLVIFFIVWYINYYQSKDIVVSLLNALTLAMSILPEEIPVAFSTFMALGAWELMQLGIIVKQIKTVETLGAATVICTDKTGTLTQNKMQLVNLYDLQSDKVFSEQSFSDTDAEELLFYAMLASEPIPFDPMEKALHIAYRSGKLDGEIPKYKMVFEYPLSGTPPMMTHIYTHEGNTKLIAAKGAPEAILAVCKLSSSEIEKINKKLDTYSKKGYRILAVAKSELHTDSYPKSQQDIKFQFLGLVIFYDPPKPGVNNTLESFYNAGIKVKIITGDNAETTSSIARQIGFRHIDKSISGDAITAMDTSQLQQAVRDNTIFSRMFPEAKLDVINALKDNREVVAMIGDGVNDGPALKAAHIGIAMGHKGTEIAKQAAHLILVDDNLQNLVDAVAMGRRIYTNLKKAIQYIISIHIPIILIVFLPLVLGWVYPNIFTPIHVIFLELIMGPTCSIVYQREPIEQDAMRRPPRNANTNFFSARELSLSIIQGLLITIGLLFVYQWSVHNNGDENYTRTMVFATLVLSNVWLTLVNRSFIHSIWYMLRHKNNLLVIIISATIIITLSLIYIPALAQFFGFSALIMKHWFIIIATSIVCVFWLDFWKLVRRSRFTNKLSA